MNKVGISLSVSMLSLIACNVSSIAPTTTGGVPFGDAGSEAGAVAPGDSGPAGDSGVVSTPDGGGQPSGGDASADAGGDGAVAVTPACDHGTVVLLSDYTSTQIALSALDGTTLSAAFLSTASTKASNLAFALSGDVALPDTAPPSARIVLIDRYGTNVITWADPTTAQVQAQLPVGTGFESNPQDYIEVDATKAYVPRWGVNDAPGKQPFDSGSDVLVIDTKKPAITGSIPMPVQGSLPPRPAGIVRVGNTFITVLQPTSEDFATTGVSALVGIQNDAIAWQMQVTGLVGCGRPALSPSGSKMALGCWGALNADGSVADLSAAGIAVYDVTTMPPTLTKIYPIRDQLGASTQNQVSFASETVIFGKTQTASGGSADNQAFALDLTSGRATALLTASKDSQGKGKGDVLNDVLCRPGCGDVCLLADSDVGRLRRWKMTAGAMQALSDVTVENITGLPPLSLSGY
jgi:hypothetical protein